MTYSKETLTTAAAFALALALAAAALAGEPSGRGRYGKIGHGGGTASSGAGRGIKSTRGGPARVRFGKMEVSGDLDKAIIRRFIRRRMAALRACYEMQLAKQPKLAGRLVVSFWITGEGKVQAPRSSGLGNKKVESCVSRQFTRIVFPKPRSGGRVKVKAPFVLSPPR